MARDARLVVNIALNRLDQRYEKDQVGKLVLKDVRDEIEYAFDLAQVPRTPGPKAAKTPKPADGK